MQQLWLPTLAPPTTTLSEPCAPKFGTRIKILAGVAALSRARRSTRGVRWLLAAIHSANLSARDREMLQLVLRELPARTQTQF